MLELVFFCLMWSQAPSDLQRAQSLFDQRRYVEAAQLAQAVRTATPENNAAWKLAGLSLQLAQQLPQAAHEFNSAVQRFPADAELWFFFARVLYLQSSLKPAEQAAERALSLRSDYGDAHTQLALIVDALNEPERALNHYRRAIALNRRAKQPNTIALSYASQLLEKRSEYTEALFYVNEALQLNAKSSALWLARGRLHEKRGEFAEAIKACEQAIALDGNAQARSLLARLRSGAAANKTTTGNTNALPLLAFRNVAQQAKLNFTLNNGATPRKYQIETMTGGLAAFDYDNDGWTDIYFVNGAELPALEKTDSPFWNRLFRNNHDGTFSDVTEKAGVKGAGFAMGAAVGDYDNDGDQDLFVAGVHRNQLFRNEGNGRFSDQSSALRSTYKNAWSVSAAWLDYDNDGDLDLFVVNYCEWNPQIDPVCGADKPGWRTYCFPDRYQGQPNQLFRNNGNSVFEDVSTASGIAQHIGKGMGVSIADYDDDGWMDVFVANDTLPNFLFRNTGKGAFEEVAFTAGVAVNDNGRPVSSMGTDFRDYDNDGLPDLIFSALEGETYPLFRNAGKGFFTDVTWASGLGQATIKRSGWGLGLFDFNNDGWKDLFTVNAHVNDNIELYNQQTYRQPNSLFANRGNGTFVEVNAFANKAAHRGCAFADFDNDGRLDIVTTALNEPAELWRNESAREQHWLAIKLVGVKSNRDGIGAKLKLTDDTGRVQFNQVTTSVGYASASSGLAHFGLGKVAKVKQLEIRWPNGISQTLREVKADRVLTVREEDNRAVK
ncbi:MAG: tetratricopeptide repeat protein [Acidobacteria bacterium]|nr:tetratricopeptide repeat protein [Acidobacteriota bacterium]